MVTPLRQWAADGTVTLRLAGVRGSYNPMPTAFSVNGTPCPALVSGPATPAAPTSAPPSADDDHDNSGPGSHGRGKNRDKDND